MVKWNFDRLETYYDTEPQTCYKDLQVQLSQQEEEELEAEDQLPDDHFLHSDLEEVHHYHHFVGYVVPMQHTVVATVAMQHIVTNIDCIVDNTLHYSPVQQDLVPDCNFGGFSRILTLMDISYGDVHQELQLIFSI